MVIPEMLMCIGMGMRTFSLQLQLAWSKTCHSNHQGHAFRSAHAKADGSHAWPSPAHKQVSLPAHPLACPPACLPTRLLAHLPACLPACLAGRLCSHVPTSQHMCAHPADDHVRGCWLAALHMQGLMNLSIPRLTRWTPSSLRTTCGCRRSCSSRLRWVMAARPTAAAAAAAARSHLLLRCYDMCEGDTWCRA